MKRQTVIIYKSEIPECFGNLKLFCDSKGLKYNTYSRKDLPFEFEGYDLDIIEISEKHHNEGKQAYNDFIKQKRLF